MAATLAASMPAMPPPMTITRFLTGVGVISISFSRPTLGLMAQVMGSVW
jgi:hypothetical protein